MRAPLESGRLNALKCQSFTAGEVPIRAKPLNGEIFSGLAEAQVLIEAGAE